MYRVLPSRSGLGQASPYPDQTTWATAVGEAVDSLSQNTRDYLAQKPWGVPIIQGVDTVAALYDQTTRVDMAGRTAVEQAQQFAETLRGVMDSSMRVIGTVAGEIGASAEVMDAIGSIAGTVPVLGAAVDAVLGLAGVIVDELTQARRDLLESTYTAKQACAQQCIAGSYHNPVPPDRTGPSGSLVPSDLFRANLLAGPSGSMPVSIGSMYILMCAPEAQGYGPTRAQYNSASYPAAARWEEIDVQTKRDMWAMIKGIMGSVREPGIGEVREMVGDGGKSLWPALNALVIRKVIDIWQPGCAQNPSACSSWCHTPGSSAREDRGGTRCVNGERECVQVKFEQRAQAMFRYLAGQEAATWCVGSSCAYETCDCACFVGDVSQPFVDQIVQFGNQLEWDLYTKLQTRLQNVKASVAGAPSIRLTPEITQRLLETSVGYKKKLQAGRFEKTAQSLAVLPRGESSISLSAAQKAALVAGGLGGSYLAYRGIKAAVKALR